MSKKKHAKNRQKKLARQKLKRKQRIIGQRRAVSPALNRHEKLAREIAAFVDSDYTWWLSHIINMAASDYENGVWNPLFDIYEDVPTPSLDDIKVAVMERFWDEDTKGWKPDGEVVGSLLAQSPKTIYNLKDILISRVQESEKEFSKEEATDEARKPHQSIVWAYFEEIKTATTSSGPTVESEAVETDSNESNQPPSQ